MKKVVEWLEKEGWSVIPNLVQISTKSLTVTKDGIAKEIRIFNLKQKKPSVRFNLDNLAFNWSSYLTQEEIKLGIKPLFVLGNQIGWNRDYFVKPEEENNNQTCLEA